MILRVRPGTDMAKRHAIVEEWYREQLRSVIPPLIEKWQRLIGVNVQGYFVQRMKTKWGSCNHHAGRPPHVLPLAPRRRFEVMPLASSSAFSL